MRQWCLNVMAVFALLAAEATPAQVATVRL